MEVKKKFFNGIGAFVCALVVLVGCLGGATNYYASAYPHPYTFYSDDLSVAENKGYQCVVIEYAFDNVVGYYMMRGSELIINQCSDVYCGSLGGLHVCGYSWEKYGPQLGAHLLDDGAWWGVASLGSPNYSSYCAQDVLSDLYNYTSHSYTRDEFYSKVSLKLVFTTHDILDSQGNVVIKGGEQSGGGKDYNASIGYLQNIKLTNGYKSGALGNYDNDSLTRKWSFSQYTTKNVDLTGGDYIVRHFIKPVAVTGYEKEDIKQEFDMYLMNEYDASPLYFTYLQKDYDDILASQGYDGLGFIDMYLKGWFVLYHHYFQILDNTTGAFGGYVHVYPYDATGDSFGVEYMNETLDDEFNYDEDGYNGYFEHEVGSGETIEDAFENAKPESEKGIDFSGVDEFADVLESYVGQVSNVTQGIGALFGSLPPWLLVTLAIGISLTVFLGVIKIIRG